MVNPQTSNAALENNNSWYEEQKSAVQTQQALFRHIKHVYIFNLPHVQEMDGNQISSKTRLCALHLGNGSHRMFGGSCQTRQHRPTRETQRNTSSNYPHQQFNVDMRSTNSRKTKPSGAGNNSEQETPNFSEPSLVKELDLKIPLNLGARNKSMQVIPELQATRGRSTQRRHVGERAEIRLES